MRKLLSSFLLLGLVLSGCQHSPPDPSATAPETAPAELLAHQDPRAWRTYSAVVLVATKYQLPIDTTAHLLESFERRFSRRPRTRLLYEAQLPNRRQILAENVAPMQADAQYFVEQGQRLNLSAATVAAVISDFYVLGGSNRDYPEGGNP